MLDRGKAGHIGTNFGQDGLGERGAEAIHRHQINASNAEQRLTGAGGGLAPGGWIWNEP